MAAGTIVEAIEALKQLGPEKFRDLGFGLSAAAGSTTVSGLLSAEPFFLTVPCVTMSWARSCLSCLSSAHQCGDFSPLHVCPLPASPKHCCLHVPFRTLHFRHVHGPLPSLGPRFGPV